MWVVSDESFLVRQAIDGDRGAFSDLAAKRWRRLLALARSIVADLEAEDVVQDALLTAWRKLGSLRDAAAFDAWLSRIVANAAVGRARRRRFFAPIDGVEVAAPGNPVEERIDVGRLLRRLAPRQRAVLHLTAVEGLTDSEIASVLGITPSSVRVHRLRARQRLQETVKEGRQP
jgi:RNA polymerase sigma-70 factor (ECF subfamily)